MNLERIYIELVRDSRCLMTNEVMNNLIHQLRDVPRSVRIVIYGRGEQMLHTESGIFIEALEGFKIDFHSSGEFPNSLKILMDIHTKVENLYLSIPHPIKRAVASSFWIGKEAVKIDAEWAIGGEKVGNIPPNPPRRKSCHFPFDSTTICFDGTVKLCPLDPSGKADIGNLLKTPFHSLWHSSKKLHWSRRFLASRIRCPLPACNKCAYSGKFDVSKSEDYCKITQSDVNDMRKTWGLS